MLTQAVSAYMDRHRMTRPGDGVLAAVSGGADSVALLLLLAELREELGLRLFAAHLNHGIRPESAGDAAFVEALCARLGVDCRVERADVPGEARARGCSLETAARDIRWDFLRREAARRNACRIATAHHRDDQAETVLLRLTRGSGAEGLRAMSARDSDIILPLLWAGRGELREYLERRGQDWREDASNRDVEIARNRIRHRVMPQLEALNPRAAEAIARSARLLGQDDRCLRALADQAYERVSRREEGLFLTGQDGGLHPAIVSRVLRRMAAELGVSRDLTAGHIDDALALLEPGHTGKRIRWPGGVTVSREAGGLLLGTGDPAPACPPVALRVPGVTRVPGLGTFTCEALSVPPAHPENFPCRVAHFDAGVFPGRVWIRTRRDGDRIWKLGAPGVRKLSDEMIDRKIPRWRRDRIPLLADGDRVLWMVGCAVAHETRITPETGETLRIDYTQEDGEET